MRKWTRLTEGWLGLLVAMIMLAASAGLLSILTGTDRSGGDREKIYYPSGKFLREATMGFREVAADFLWFESVQYYGAYRKGENDLRYYRGLVDSVTDLDPKFVEAYYFASLVASMDQSQISSAVDLLKKGILANPDRWILPFNIGFTYYVMTQEYDRAALWFDIASRAPDASDFARRFAAFARKRAGNVEGSLALWQNLLKTTSNPAMQDLAQRMIDHCQDLLRQQEQEGRQREGL